MVLDPFDGSHLSRVLPGVVWFRELIFHLKVSVDLGEPFSVPLRLGVVTA